MIHEFFEFFRSLKKIKNKKMPPKQRKIAIMGYRSVGK